MESVLCDTEFEIGIGGKIKNRNSYLLQGNTK